MKLAPTRRAARHVGRHISLLSNGADSTTVGSRWALVKLVAAPRVVCVCTTHHSRGGLEQINNLTYLVGPGQASLARSCQTSGSRRCGSVTSNRNGPERWLLVGPSSGLTSISPLAELLSVVGGRCSGCRGWGWWQVVSGLAQPNRQLPFRPRLLLYILHHACTVIGQTSAEIYTPSWNFAGRVFSSCLSPLPFALKSSRSFCANVRMRNTPCRNPCRGTDGKLG